MWQNEVERALHIMLDRTPDAATPSIRMLDLLSKVLAPSESVRFMAMVKQDIDGKVRNDLPLRLLCLSEYYCYLLTDKEVQRYGLDVLDRYTKKSRRGETVITWKRVGKLDPLVFVLEADAERSLAKFVAEVHQRMVSDRGRGHMTLSHLNEAIQKVYLACTEVTKIPAVHQVVTPEQLYVDAMIVGYQEVVSMLNEACERPRKTTVAETNIPVISSAGGMIVRTLREAVDQTSGNLLRGSDVGNEISMNRTFADDRSFLKSTYWSYVRHLAEQTDPQPWNDLVKALCDIFLLASIYRPAAWTMDDVDDKRFLPHRETEMFARKWLILTPDTTNTFDISKMLE